MPSLNLGNNKTFNVVVNVLEGLNQSQRFMQLRVRKNRILIEFVQTVLGCLRRNNVLRFRIVLTQSFLETNLRSFQVFLCKLRYLKKVR
mgnify:CR=1 FL=1